MEPTVVTSTVAARNVSARGDGSFVVEMEELFTGWFEVANLAGAPGSTVTFNVSTMEGTVEEYNMANAYTFGASGAGNFRMRFSYNEIQYITINGLSKPPALADVVGKRLAVDLRRTGHFESSSSLVNKEYAITVNNYLGLTTGGMTVDCPHRERRGYGGDGHTSYQFALAHFGVGAYFTKWARDFADVQTADGNVPHTAPTVSGGGGPAWSGFVITLPYEVHRAHGDTRLLAQMYPTMQRLLAFFANHTDATDQLLHPWTTSKWDFLGDWIMPTGSEDDPNGKPESLFNNAYLRYITGRAAVARASSDVRRRRRRRSMRRRRASTAGINAAYANATSGVYLDTKQTHLVLPLAAGAVLAALRPTTFSELEHTIVVRNSGHLDTGLTGTYFLTKLLVEAARNDLLFLMNTQTDFPGYGNFVARGFTTWPEDWVAKPGAHGKGVSKMHGCYNAVGLWFLDGLAGLTYDASRRPPLAFRAAVEAASAELTWVRGEREVPEGVAASSWSVVGFAHNVTVPPNARARAC